MTSQQSLIIGLDRCSDSVVGSWPGSEARARQLDELLAHPCLGAFGDESHQLMLGARVHQEALTSTLFRQLVKNANSTSRHFVYLALPTILVSIQNEWRHYVVTRDLAVRKLLDNPFAGISVQQIAQDMLSWSPAKEIVLVLDGPLVGALTRRSGETRPTIRPVENAPELRFGMLEPGRAVLAHADPQRGHVSTSLLDTLHASESEETKPCIDGTRLIERMTSQLGEQVLHSGCSTIEMELSYPMTRAARDALERRRDAHIEVNEPHPLEQVAIQLRDFCEGQENHSQSLSEFLPDEPDAQLEYEDLEASVLDSWRGTYGELPESLKERRHELFSKKLERITTWFQPIIRLGRKHVRIAGWEALARDPNTLRVPSDLFDCVELWGEPFMSELDSQLATSSVELFHHLLTRDPVLGPQSELYDLSINVYPESLMSPHYFEHLAELLASELILPERLVLEISEKQELPAPDPITGEDPFRDVLKSFVRELGVHFSIDDLGDAHATVDRLQDLDPLHVKIDRSVLQHEDVAAELAYIIDLVGPGQLSPSHIVVEGVDEDCPLSLPELFAIGVKFVQGFSLARPSPEIYPLDRDLAEFLAARVSEEAPIRAPRLLKHYA
jgi:EAL domain-containing protein (putative c-di-GMP-specific phosphodiesterase class I)